LKSGRKQYPSTLVTTADTDDRVVPGHSFKFAAALQEMQTGESPVLIRIESRAGHGAGKPTAKQIEEAADLWAFLVKALNMTLPPAFARADEPPTNDELWVAAKKGQPDVVETLLKRGLDADAATEYGVTALQYAAGKGHLEVVRVLIEHKVDVNRKDRFYGLTALSWAASKGHWKVIAALLDAGADGGGDLLPSAASAGEVEVVRAALAKGTIKQETLNGALASAPADNVEIIELLEKAGAKRPVSVAAEKFTEPLTPFVGTYRDERGNEFGVALVDGKLFLTFDDMPIVSLVRKGERSFTPGSDIESTYEFERDGEKIVRFVAKRGDRKQIFERSTKPDIAIPAAPNEDDDSAVIASQNWPSFRGPQASGIADGQKPPTSWDVEKEVNLRWKTSIPGLGLACPIVWDDRIYVTTAVRTAGKSVLKVGLYGNVDSADDLTEHS
jgi:hypothetical protein